MFSKYHEKKGEEGFTLIELLVVIIIIGILAAIAIPTFLGQRERARRGAVQSDLRNAAVAQETYFTDNGTYAAAGNAEANLPGLFNGSDQVTTTIVSSSANAFCMKAVHAAGLPATDGGAWYYDSDGSTQLTDGSTPCT